MTSLERNHATRAAETLPLSHVVVLWDQIMASVSEALRRELEELMPPGQYEFQTEFAKRYFGAGRAGQSRRS